MTFSAQVSITKAPPRKRSKNEGNGHEARTRRAQQPVQFIAVDGEGITLPDGEHRYVLLGVGDQRVTDPAGLSFEACCEFLWEQFLANRQPGTKIAYVGFFLGYDFIQMFRSLPEERARCLLTTEGRLSRVRRTNAYLGPFPVRYGTWEFDILGNKRFRLRKHSKDCSLIITSYGDCSCGSAAWMNICDTGPFFQKAFLKVINPKEWDDPVVTPEEYAIIKEGKAKRTTAQLDNDMVRYNALENAILPRVLSRLDEGFRSLGIKLNPDQWYGPGQAAQAWLTGRAITAEQLWDVTPSAVLESARESYFGGWFEIMVHGTVQGISYEYDINSAYPYIISTLPCLEHGKWSHNDSDRAG